MADEERLRTELEAALARVQALEAELDVARVNAKDAEQQIIAARANMGILEAQIVGARRERERLLALVEQWRAKAMAKPGFWSSLFARKAGSPLPKSLRAARDRVSQRYLRGAGVEIGALHSPVGIPRAATVRYVDRLSTAELLREYPEQAEFALVEVDIVDEGETLSTIAPESLDFIVANHMLEHCENPLGTLRNHLSKLGSGGRLLYIVPDRRGSFDAARELTRFEHLERDDREGPEQSRLGHYREYAERVEKVAPEEVEVVARDMLAAHTNIHFHVWEGESFREFLEAASRHLGDAFELLHFEHSETELIAVLQKR